MTHLRHTPIMGGILAIGAGAATFPYWSPLLDNLKQPNADGWIVYRGNGPPESVTLTLNPAARATAGDRFRAMQGDEPVEVLLCGIKPPPQEPHASDAATFLQEALDQSKNGTVYVVPYMTRPGAIAGDLFVPIAAEPEDIERFPAGELILAGLATKAQNPCWSDQLLQSWEEQAKAGGIGMWRSP